MRLPLYKFFSAFFGTFSTILPFCSCNDSGYLGYSGYAGECCAGAKYENYVQFVKNAVAEGGKQEK
jgi:hypothetical protein